MPSELKPPYAEEIKLIKQYVDKDSICLDIGANVGQFTIFLASIAKYVYTCEPEFSNFVDLQNNTNSLKNVSHLNAAVSDKSGYSILYICPNDNGMHRLYNSKWCEGGEQIRVRTVKLDNSAMGIGKISFIKIDIEGYEYYAIKGATKLIKRDSPVIMMEWHPPTLIEANTDPKELYSLMINLGYQNPKHMLLNKDINSYEELFNYTNDIPAINILWIPKK